MIAPPRYHVILPHHYLPPSRMLTCADAPPAMHAGHRYYLPLHCLACVPPPLTNCAQLPQPPLASFRRAPSTRGMSRDRAPSLGDEPFTMRRSSSRAFFCSPFVPPRFVLSECLPSTCRTPSRVSPSPRGLLPGAHSRRSSPAFRRVLPRANALLPPPYSSLHCVRLRRPPPPHSVPPSAPAT